MKIYFEDGRLRDCELLPFDYDYEVNAKDGYMCNREKLDGIKDTYSNSKVYTNSLVALSSRYCWNDKLKVPELYIRSGEKQEFVRVDSLTDRKLRESHNLLKMYINGEFDKKE